MFHKSFFTLLTLIILTNGIVVADVPIQGRILDLHTGKGIPGVEVFSDKQGTITDTDGFFQLVLDQPDSVMVRSMGYESKYLSAYDVQAEIMLKSKILAGQSINVLANRVIPGITPVAYSTLDAEEIRVRYSVEDVPMILSSEAGVYAYRGIRD